MSQKISPIIKPQELLLVKQTKEIVLIDARAGIDAKQRYAAMHLEGALHVHLEEQLAAISGNAENGGRHPLPDPGQFSLVLQQLGITPASHVIVYDDKNGSNAAARFWWMLRSIGHEFVQVIDGGFDAAVSGGLQVSAKVESPAIVESYGSRQWVLPLADINDVQHATQDNEFIVIDVRDAIRFSGEKEPIDLVAGHIPGAINIPFSSNLNENGSYLSPSELRDKYTLVLNKKKADQIIVHCGSGVTACHTILAMDYAEMDIPKLYVGSWSEWSRNDKPVATSIA